MASFYTERRIIPKSTSLSWDLAHHMYMRQLCGKIVVVAESPAILLSAVSKQWHKVIRQTQRERSSTLNAERIRELTQTIMDMQKLRFVANTLHIQAKGDVFFASPEELLPAPPGCRTLYVTCQLEESILFALTSNMPAHSLIVLY